MAALHPGDPVQIATHREIGRVNNGDRGRVLGLHPGRLHPYAVRLDSGRLADFPDEYLLKVANKTCKVLEDGSVTAEGLTDWFLYNPGWASVPGTASTWPALLLTQRCRIPPTEGPVCARSSWHSCRSL